MPTSSPEIQSIITYCVSQAAKCPATRYPEVCFTCDPPSVKFIEIGVAVEEPYICEVCQQRALKKTQRDTKPLSGRMNHGESDAVAEGRRIPP